MSKRKTTDAKHLQDHDQNILEPNTYLKTDNQHKDWYNVHEMGKQGGKPKANPREIKKQSGTKKHSLRKEK